MSKKNDAPNMARVDLSRAAQYALPGDVLADLQDAFTFYDKENNGWITSA